MATKLKNRMAELQDDAPPQNGRVKKAKSISLSAISLQPERSMFTIYGISPLIVRTWGEKANKMIEDKQQKKG